MSRLNLETRASCSHPACYYYLSSFFLTLFRSNLSSLNYFNGKKFYTFFPRGLFVPCSNYEIILKQNSLNILILFIFQYNFLNSLRFFNFSSYIELKSFWPHIQLTFHIHATITTLNYVSTQLEWYSYICNFVA